MTAFAKRLEAAFEKSILSKKAVAAELGVSYGAVMSWFSGDRTPRGPTLKALAKLLDVDPTWLETGDELNSPNAYKSDVSGKPCVVKDTKIGIHGKAAALVNKELYDKIWWDATTKIIQIQCDDKPEKVQRVSDTLRQLKNDLEKL